VLIFNGIEGMDYILQWHIGNLLLQTSLPHARRHSTTSGIDDGTTPPHLLFRSAGKKQAAAGVQRFLNFQTKTKGFENLRARTFALSIGMDAATLVSRSEKDLGFWIKKGKERSFTTRFRHSSRC